MYIETRAQITQSANAREQTKQRLAQIMKAYYDARATTITTFLVTTNILDLYSNVIPLISSLHRVTYVHMTSHLKIKFVATTTNDKSILSSKLILRQSQY